MLMHHNRRPIRSCHDYYSGLGWSHVIDDLVAIGFSSQEARTYVALLRQPMATGYEVAKVAGLQRANAYATLGTLEERGAVQLAGSNPARYTATPPKEVLARVRRETTARCDRLSAALAAVRPAAERPALWSVQGRDAVVERVVGLVDEAAERVVCSAWAEDVDWLRPSLEAAAASGRDVVVNSFGPVVLAGASVYEHEPSDRAVGERIVTVSVDRSTAVVAMVEEPASAVYTTHPALVALVEKVLRDEAYLAAIFRDLRKPLEKRFGPHLVDLRAELLPLEDAARLRAKVAAKAAD
jgi:sugar-specific transcriptional regulator TrmB